MRILIAEDEAALCRALVRIFERNNYSVDAVSDGVMAWDYLEAGSYDCVVLDIMMPRMDGIELLGKMRSSGNGTPVVILSAKGEVEDRILGLDTGADYYLPKPFDTGELLAAVRAVTRQSAHESRSFNFGNITLDRARFTLSGPDGSSKLANKEFQILELLMANPGVITSTERFMEKIWGLDCESEISVVWSYICYLRRKLEAVGANVRIAASRNAGYTLELIK